MRGVGMEKMVQPLGGGQPKQRKPQAEHQNSRDGAAEAADTTGWGFSAHSGKIKPPGLVQCKQIIFDYRAVTPGP